MATNTHGSRESEPITIQVGSIPVPTIVFPEEGSTFRAGDIVTFAGTATDASDDEQIELRWTIDFRHNEHFHPVALGILSGEGSIEIPSNGHDFSGDTAYRFTLTATNSFDLSQSTTVEILPEKTDLILQTVPSGLPIMLDEIPRKHSICVRYACWIPA